MTGKGANNIISMLHHFLATHNFGEAHLHLHADNCSGQNKNHYVMQYLAWCILSGLNNSGALRHGTCIFCQKYGVVKLVVSGQYFEMFVRFDFMNVGTLI